MTQADWRSPDAYEYVAHLSPAGLAFEFLRRNPNYRDDFDHARNEAALGGGEEAADSDGFARRWGLAFSRRSGRPRRPANPVLTPRR